jgi:hypothetical protein
LKIGTIIGLAAVAAVLAAAAQYTERRSVPAWAPNASIAKPKAVETAALPDGKVQAALPAAAQPAPSSEIAVASRPSTVDAEATGGLPKEPEAAAQAPAPEVSPAPAREHRQARPAKPARAAETAPASRPAPRDPIQFRLAERGGN